MSALAFNADHSRLLVGNARGHILEYDMKDGKLLRTLNDVHPPEAAVLHLKVYFNVAIKNLLKSRKKKIFLILQYSLQTSQRWPYSATVVVLFLN